MYVVINGGGKVASSLARMLTEKHHTVAVIEKRPDVAERLATELAGFSVLVIRGDGCDVRVLEEAGIERADVFVAVTGEDDDNLVSCELAQASFDLTRIIARVNNPKNLPIFEKFGIETISPTVLIARMIEEETLLGGLHTLRTLHKGNLVLAEVELAAEGPCRAAGRRIAAVGLPRDCKVVAVLAAATDDVEIALPETVLSPGDILIIAAAPGRVGELSTLLNGA